MYISEKRKDELIREIEERLKDRNFDLDKILELSIQNSLELNFVSEFFLERQIQIENHNLKGEKTEIDEVPSTEEKITESEKNPRASQSASYSRLSKEEEMELWKQLATTSGEERLEIRNRLAESYMQFARWLTYKMAYGGNYLSYKDIEQEAMIGLLKAIEKYDYKQGYTFISYAKFHVVGSVYRARLQGLNKEYEAYLRRMKRFENEYLTLSDSEKEKYVVDWFLEEPNSEDYAKILNVSEDKIIRALEYRWFYKCGYRINPEYEKYLKEIEKIDSEIQSKRKEGKSRVKYAPTQTDYAKDLNVSESKVSKILEYKNRKDIITISDLMEDIRNANVEEHVNKDDYVMDSDSDVYYAEGIVEPAEEEPSDFISDMLFLEEIEHDELKNLIDNVLDKLNPRERMVLELRYGLNGREAYSLREIAKQLKVSGTRIEQIEKKALRRLRKPWISKNLKEYLEEDR